MNKKEFNDIVKETNKDIEKNLKKLHGQLAGYFLKPNPIYSPRNAKEYLKGYIDSSYKNLEKISSKFGFEYKRSFNNIDELLNKLEEKARKHADDYGVVFEWPSPDNLNKQLDELDKKQKEDINNFLETLLINSS